MCVVIVDTGNLYYCVNKRFPGRRLDYAKYLAYIAEKYGEVRKAIAFVTLSDAFITPTDFVKTSKCNPKGFMDYLRAQGFCVKTQQSMRHRVGGKFIWTTDFSIAITVEVLENKRWPIILGSSALTLLPLLDFDPKIHIEAAGIGANVRKAALTATEISGNLLHETTSPAQ